MAVCCIVSDAVAVVALNLAIGDATVSGYCATLSELNFAARLGGGCAADLHGLRTAP
jgi:hypothetical protein